MKLIIAQVVLVLLLTANGARASRVQKLQRGEVQKHDEDGAPSPEQRLLNDDAGLVAVGKPVGKVADLKLANCVTAEECAEFPGGWYHRRNQAEIDADKARGQELLIMIGGNTDDSDAEGGPEISEDGKTWQAFDEDLQSAAPEEEPAPEVFKPKGAWGQPPAAVKQAPTKAQVGRSAAEKKAMAVSKDGKKQRLEQRLKRKKAGLQCDQGSNAFETRGVPSDCRAHDMSYGIEGQNDINKFGLRYCFDKSTKISSYVQQVMRKSQRRNTYSRGAIMFKTNPRLSVCDQQAPSWYACSHMDRNQRSKAGFCGNKNSSHNCINHPVQPPDVCNSMVFSGKSCRCPRDRFNQDQDCEVNERICKGYSAYENKVCNGWDDDSDYDRGHLAASSDTFDDEEARSYCHKVGGKGPLKWADPYDRDGPGIAGSEWHKGDYSQCAWTASFMMTNVVPQGSLLNQICWRDIEVALKVYSEAKTDLFVAIGNSRAGKMRGQKTAIERGYDASSADMVLTPQYQWKVACTYQDGGDPANPFAWKPTACTAWLVANRNIAIPEGCRTPLTLNQLKFLLDSLGELSADGSIPGVPAEWESAALLPSLRVLCTNNYEPEYCSAPQVNGQQLAREWSDTTEDDTLTVNAGRMTLTCHKGASCADTCHCCDDNLIGKLKNAQANGGSGGYTIADEEMFPALG